MTNQLETAVAAVGRIESVPMILDIICRTTGMGFAAVARVTEDRWAACAVLDRMDFGLAVGGELPLRTTICHRVRENAAGVAFDDARDDPLWRDDPAPKLYGFRSYISTPIIRTDGTIFGTLCAIDVAPRTVNTPEMLATFSAFATLIASSLDQLDEVDRSRTALVEERSQSTLREEFIAVLGHDLRNPLAAVSGGLRLLRRHSLDESALPLMQLMEGSVRRMAGLIDNVMDFARGRLGGGLGLGRTSDEPLAPLLDQVVDELRAAQPTRRIVTHFDLAQRVACDRQRIGQMFSNLLANALTHGAADGLVEVRASTRDGGLMIEVVNGGVAIPQAAMAKLFQPFTRNAVWASQQGLGLGLYIASMIAQAHGGTISVASSDEQTRFTFRMPPGVA